jgi:hypothetical protein
VPAEAARESLRKSGTPPEYLDALMDLLAAMKAGEADVATDAVENVTARKAGAFEVWAQRNIAAFK